MAVVDAFAQASPQDDAPGPLAQPLQDPPTLSTVYDGKNLASNAPPPLPPQQVASPLFQQPPHKQTAKEKSEVVHFFMPSFDAVMPLFCSSLTNFLVAAMAKSANRNISAPRQDINRPMPPTPLTT